VNLTEYAKHSGRSKPLISRWIKPGGLLEKACKRNGRNVEINAEEADALLEVMLDQSKSRRTSIPKGKDKLTSSYQDALAQDKYYAAALKKLKLDREEGLFVLKSDVEKTAFNTGRQIKEQCLSIADRCSPLVAAESDAFQCKQILLTEINYILEELSNALRVVSK